MKILRILLLLLASSSFSLHSQSSQPESLKFLDSLSPELKEEFIKKSEKDSSLEDKKNVQSLVYDQPIQDEEEIDTASINEQEQVFGYSYFNKKIQLNSSPELNVPLRTDYILGPGDGVEISISGNENKFYRLNLDLAGSLLIPEIGELSLGELSLAEANDKLNAVISQKYIGSEASISVKSPGLKRISVVGAIKSPGSYVVNPFTSIADAIIYAGGPIDGASLRKIEVISLDGSKKVVDFYEFLVFGKQNENLVLKNGDSLFLPVSTMFLEINGEVNRPMIYEYLEDSSVGDIVKYSLGFTRKSDDKKIFINEIVNNRIVTSKAKTSEKLNSNYIESITVSGKVFIEDKNIRVNGDAVSSGYYAPPESSRLIEVIDSLKFSEDIYPYFFIIEQSNGLGKQIKFFSIFEREVLREFTLRKNVEITFFSKSDIEKYQQFLLKEELEKKLIDFNVILEREKRLEDISESSNQQLNNQSASQEKDQRVKSIKLQIQKINNYLNLDNKIILENFKKISDENKLQINTGKGVLTIPMAGSYIPKQIYEYFGLPVLEKNIERITVTSENGFKANASNQTIEFVPNQSINIPELRNSTIAVEVSGMVKFPGKYQISRNTTLNDLYEIVGGANNFANLQGIVFTRESVRVREENAYNSAKDFIIDYAISSLANPSNFVNGQLDLQVFELLQTSDSIEFGGRVSGDLSPDSDLSRTLLLEDGDSIFVSSKTNTISVFGEVLNSGTYVFNSDLSLDDYLEVSGGLTDLASKGDIYIISSDGISRSASNGRFRNGKLLLYPGDTIVVPKNLNKVSLLPVVSAATRVISDIAFSAAAINSLRN